MIFPAHLPDDWVIFYPSDGTFLGYLGRGWIHHAENAIGYEFKADALLVAKESRKPDEQAPWVCRRREYKGSCSSTCPWHSNVQPRTSER